MRAELSKLIGASSHKSGVLLFSSWEGKEAEKRRFKFKLGRESRRVKEDFEERRLGARERSPSCITGGGGGMSMKAVTKLLH